MGAVNFDQFFLPLLIRDADMQLQSFDFNIDVTFLPGTIDPESECLLESMQSLLGADSGIVDLKTRKSYDITIQAVDLKEAEQKAEEYTKKFFVYPALEEFNITPRISPIASK